MTEVRIGLPLPLDITGTLIAIIGLTYPGTVIKDGTGEWRYENQLVLNIPDDERHKSAKKAEKYLKVKRYLDANADAEITELGPNGGSLGTPDYLSRILITYAKGWIDAHPDAENYVEMTVMEKETGKAYEIIVARSKEQTPHALAAARLERIKELEAELNQLKGARDMIYDKELT